MSQWYIVQIARKLRRIIQRILYYQYCIPIIYFRHLAYIAKVTSSPKNLLLHNCLYSDLSAMWPRRVAQHSIATYSITIFPASSTSIYDVQSYDAAYPHPKASWFGSKAVPTLHQPHSLPSFSIHTHCIIPFLVFYLGNFELLLFEVLTYTWLSCRMPRL